MKFPKNIPFSKQKSSVVKKDFEIISKYGVKVKFHCSIINDYHLFQLRWLKF